MQKIDFTVILIGAQDDDRRAVLAAELQSRTGGLHESGERLVFADQNSLGSVPSDARTTAIVLCREGMSDAETEAIEECARRNIPIIPVVASLADFNIVAPKAVSHFNGFELAHIDDIGELAGLVLESLGLQRSKRKIFISYARQDSSRMAQQLREAFTARWYSVFLDTISIRPGALFQEELLQELADSDVVVLLNSASVRNRPYVQQEIAFADQAGIGGVLVVWPGVPAMREGGFFMPVLLDGRLAEIEDGAVEILTPEGITKILRQVADLRTGLQQLRENQLLTPVRAYAESKGWQAISYLGRYIELRDGSRHIRLDVALGVPTSTDLERAFETGRLIYDPLGVTNRQGDHLDFLASHLSLQYLHPKDTLEWKVIP